MPPDLPIPLECIRSGEWACVEDIVGEPALVCRLAELGLRAGCRLRVLCDGHPCLLEVGGARLSVRFAPGFQVLVRPEAAAAV